MSRSTKQTVPLEIELHEPEDRGDGTTSMPMWLLFGGGTYEHEGKKYAFGFAGNSLVAYLPDYKAISVSVETLINAGLKTAAEAAA